MELVTVRSVIAEKLAEIKRYQNDSPKFFGEITDFNPDSYTFEDFKRLGLYAGAVICSECGNVNIPIVQLGEEPDYDTKTAWICKECLIKALALFES